VRKAAADAVEALGGAAATPEILARVAELLRDPEGDVRKAAADAVEALGGAAGTPEFLARLAELLRDPEGDGQAAAADAVGRMGARGVRIFKEPGGKWEWRSVTELADTHLITADSQEDVN
jgi:HEAT repeat protein